MLTTEEKLRFNTWFIYQILNDLIYKEDWEAVKSINDQLPTPQFYKGDRNTHYKTTIRVVLSGETKETVERLLENHNHSSNYLPVTLEEIGYKGQDRDTLDYYYDFHIYMLTEYNFCKEF